MISCYGKPYWIAEIIRILPCTKKLQDPKLPEVIPRANSWRQAKQTVKDETSYSSEVHTRLEIENGQFATCGAEYTG